VKFLRPAKHNVVPLKTESSPAVESNLSVVVFTKHFTLLYLSLTEYRVSDSSQTTHFIRLSPLTNTITTEYTYRNEEFVGCATVAQKRHSGNPNLHVVLE
jgi:hypothetical protein